MSVVMEKDSVVATATELRAVRGSQTAPALPKPLAKLAAPLARGRSENWCSTLEPADLARLLDVIESRLIPRLVAKFTPAHCASLEARRKAR